MSRCSGSPPSRCVLHEPQVPLSHELGTRYPWARTDVDHRARLLQPDHEGFVYGMGFRIHSEAFEVNGARRPVTSHILHAVHQPFRSAAVDMRVGGLLEYRPEVERLFAVAVVVVDLDLPRGNSEFSSSRNAVHWASRIR